MGMPYPIHVTNWAFSRVGGRGGESDASSAWLDPPRGRAVPKPRARMGRTGLSGLSGLSGDQSSCQVCTFEKTVCE